MPINGGEYYEHGTSMNKLELVSNLHEIFVEALRE